MVIEVLEKRLSLSCPFRVARTREHQCSGVSAIEYAIIVSLIAAAILAGFSTVATEVRDLYTIISEAIGNAI
jgi:Flp pilus assembly pilin Flp